MQTTRYFEEQVLDEPGYLGFCSRIGNLRTVRSPIEAFGILQMLKFERIVVKYIQIGQDKKRKRG